MSSKYSPYYSPSPSKKRKLDNEQNYYNNEYSSQKSFRKNDSYHREGSCEASLSDLATKMEFYAKQNNINDGLFQIETCINERETVTKNRIENGQTTDENHQHVIDILKAFKNEYEELSTKMNDIPDKIENGKKIKNIEIYFDRSKFMFVIKHGEKQKSFSDLLKSYGNSKKGGKRKNRKTQKQKTENKKYTKLQNKKRNKKTSIVKQK